MQRVCLFACSAAGFLLASIAAAPAAPPQILAPHALLVEAETGSVLYEKQADDLVAPASLAKLMTVNIAFNLLKTGKIKVSDEYLISENAWRKGGAVSHGSTMYAVLHSRVRVEDLIKGIVIQSATERWLAV